MNLHKVITIQPPSYVDQSGNRVSPAAFEIDKLNITYLIRPHTKYIGAQIDKIPGILDLVSGSSFDILSDLNTTTLEGLVRLKLGTDPKYVLESLFPRTLESDPHGPGTVLSEMLSFIGIKSTANCSCKRHAITMNTKGNDWCEANIDTILGWLKTESAKRNLPYIESVARLIVNRAIKTSRKLLSKNNV